MHVYVYSGDFQSIQFSRPQLRVAAASAGIQYEDNRLRTLASYDGVSVVQGDALGLCSSSAGVNLSGNQPAIMIGATA